MFISEIARNFQLPVSLFDISATDEWPRLPSGKTDYQAILQAAIARRKAVPRGGEKSVADAFAALLNRAAVSPNDSFVTLEGDSLSYVSVASELDQIGRAHVLTPVTNAQLVCRLLLEKKKTPYI